jgi:hypothetical protein
MGESKNVRGGVSRWWAVPSLIIGGFVGWLVSRVAPIAMAEASGISASVFTIVMVVYWREKWFWPFMAFIGLSHVAAILFLPWPPTHKFAKGDLLFVWLDFFLYVGVAFLIARLSPRLAGKPKGS